jgi:hypothetical protein
MCGETGGEIGSEIGSEVGGEIGGEIGDELRRDWALTLRSRALAAPSATARAILVGLVTVRSSPTICTSLPYLETISDQFSQSSSSNPSSIVTIGKSRIKPP